MVPLDNTPPAHVRGPLGIFGLRIINHGFPVHLNEDAPVPHADTLDEPLVVPDLFFEDIFNSVEASGQARVGVGIVDLGFISPGRPPLVLELGVEINARIRARCGQDLHLEFEVLEISEPSRIADCD